MIDLDELDPVPILIPADLEKKVGFDRSVGIFAGSEARYIGFWWMPGANDPAVTDGFTTVTGPDGSFLKWDREAGTQLLEKAAEHREDYSKSDVPDYATPLSSIMASDGLDIGMEARDGQLEGGNAAFLLDSKQRELYIAPRDSVKSFLQEHNEPVDNGLSEAVKESFRDKFEETPSGTDTDGGSDNSSRGVGNE
jgi:hypothetical protein